MRVLKVSILALIMMTIQALGHQWYPLECCSSVDCAPASLTYIPGTDEVLVSTRHGQVILPKGNLKPRPSMDGEPHACINKDRDGKDRVICLFLPTGV